MKSIFYILIILVTVSCNWTIRKTLNLNQEIIFESRKEAESYFKGLGIKNSFYIFPKCNIELFQSDSFFTKPSVVSRPHFFFYNSKGEYLDLVKHLKVCSNGYLDKPIRNGEANFDSVDIIKTYNNLDSVLICTEDAEGNTFSLNNIEKVDYYILMYWNSIVENRYRAGINNIQTYLDNKFKYSFIVVSKDKILSNKK